MMLAPILMHFAELSATIHDNLMVGTVGKGM